MRDRNDIHKQLVRELIKGPGSDLWSRKHLRKDTPLFSITFNTSQLRTPAYSTVTHSPQDLPKNLQKQFTDVIQNLVTSIQQKTGVKISISSAPSPKSENVLFVCVDTFAQTEDHTAGITRSVYTEGGSANGPAFSKIISFNAEYLRKLPRLISQSPAFEGKIFNATAAHEFGHAVGLSHPMPLSSDQQSIWTSLETFWRLGFVPLRKDTIMAGTSNIQKCFDNHPDADKEVFCGHLFPDSLFSKEDVVAIEEQVKRSMNSSYISAYLHPENAPDLFKDLLQLFKSGVSACLAAFARALIQHYIKPKLIQEFHLNNKTVDMIGYSMQLVIDVTLFALPNALLSNATNILITVISNALQQWKINFDLKKLQILFVAIDTVIKSFPSNIVTAVAGALLGHQSAMKLVHMLPKLRLEDKPLPQVAYSLN